jgi:ABC-type branched-subunit amino acid transport system ATPase component/branched-subunit amino acid ABC-type transport system permease component
MNQFLEFAVLGIGPGAIYGLIGIAIVAVHRGSGVINFAAGSMAMSSAFVYYTLQDNEHLGTLPAAVVAVAAGALLGTVVYAAALRPLERASSLVQMIATLGVLTILQACASLIYGTNTLLVGSVLPTNSLRFAGLTVGLDRVIMLCIALALTTALTSYYRLTRVGLATAALAENPLSVVTQGFSPVRLKTITWAVGGSLTGVAGILIAPISGLSITTLTELVVEALAAALIGSMMSLWMTLFGAILIGITESVTIGYISLPGASEAIPLIAIIIVLIARGKRLPVRGHVGLRLPAVGSGRIRPVPLILVSLIVLVSVGTWLPQTWAIAFLVSAVTAVLCLSVVVVTGITGQISLAQFAIAGLGALVAAWTGTNWHLPFVISLLVAGLAMVPVGLLLAAVSFRVRGSNLAIVTLAAAVIVEVLLFVQIQQLAVPTPSLWISLDPILYPRRYALFCICTFVLLALLVAWLRRSELGKRMLAVRGNEVAAASIGINVAATKAQSFVIAAFIAGIGGGLLAYQNPFVVFSNFDVFGSINLVVWSVIGGVGYVLGPIWASFFQPGGIGTSVGNLLSPSIQNYLPLAGGVLLILILIQGPDGAVRQNIEMLHAVARRLGPAMPERLRRAGTAFVRDGKRRRAAAAGRAADYEADEATRAHVGDVVLEVSDVSVSFGGVQALSRVALEVRAGQVIGLIGSNGAGKTTLIDVVTGMVRLDSGSVAIAGRQVGTLRVHERARLGLARSFQSLELFDELTTMDNLELAAHRPHGRGARPRRIAGQLVPAQVMSTAAALGLSDLLEASPQSLSYGQRRLLAVARALAARPQIVLLDEPAAGLDSVEVAELGDLIRRTSQATGVGVLLVEHHVGMVMQVCDRIVVMDNGVIIASGTPAEVQSDPVVVSAYLGQSLVRPVHTPKVQRQ